MWSEEEAILWFLAGATTVAVVLFAVDIIRGVRERRARYARYHQLNTEPQRLTRPVDLGDSIGMDRREAIQLDAENAARISVLRPGHEPRNPYQKGSPDSILWFATYNLTLTQMADTVDIDLSEPLDAPVATTPYTTADLHFWTYTSTQPQA